MFNEYCSDPWLPVKMCQTAAADLILKIQEKIFQFKIKGCAVGNPVWPNIAERRFYSLSRA